MGSLVRRWVAIWLCFASALFAAMAAVASPALWQVSDSRSGGKAYLFGSVHFAPPELYPLPTAVERAFLQSDELVVELDIAAVSPNVAAQVIREKGRFREGEGLSQHLSDPARALLADACITLGLPISAFEQLKPWLVAVQLAAFQMRSAGYDDRLGVDRHFIHRTKGNDGEGPQSLLELETFEQQIDLFGALTIDQQVQFLEQALADFSEGGGLLESIMSAWRSGDEAQIERLIHDGFSGDPLAEQLYGLIYTQRNQNMASQLVDLLREGRQLFVVVGAGHLVGQQGVAQLLKAQGLKLKRVK